MNKTPIEWADFTINPFRFQNLATGKVGHHCTKISPGCKFCYSSKMQTGPYLSGLEFIEDNKPKGEFFLDEGALEQVLRRKKPARIFWCDMTDMFLDDYPDEWIDRCFAVMALTPWLTHLVLTKRAERMREYFKDLAFRTEMIGIHAEYQSGVDRFMHGGETGCDDDVIPRWKLPLKNVWLGVSCENQQYADERIPLLLQTPAAVRFISAEPLLGPADIRRYLEMLGQDFCQNCGDDARRFLVGSDIDWTPGGDGLCRECGAPRSATGYDPVSGEYTGLDLVIVGGESGPGARPMHPDWARGIRDQCIAAGVPFFFKQWGEWVSTSEVEGAGRHHRFPDGATVRRVGKKKAGRLLDGVEWNELPEVRHA